MNPESDSNKNTELDIDDLIQTLSYIDRNADVQLTKRLDALNTLGQAGEAAVPAIASVIRMNFSGQMKERLRAKEILDVMVPDWYNRLEAQAEIPFLMTKLKKDRLIANKAIRFLGQMKNVVVSEAMPELSSEVQNDYYRANVIQLLSEINPEGNELLNSLNDLLAKTKQGQLLEAIAEAIIRMKKADENTIDGLVKLLDENSSTLREKGIRAIGAGGANVEAAIPSLLKCLSDDAVEVREVAIEVLTNAEHELTEEVYKEVIEKKGELKEEQVKHIFDKLDFWISKSAAEDFQINAGRFRDNLSWYSLELANSMQKPRLFLQSVLTILANKKAERKELTPAILQICKEYDHSRVKEKAVELLAYQTTQQEEIIPVLILLLEDPVESVRQACLTTLGALNPNWFALPEVVGYFKKLIDQLDSSEAEASKATLLTMGDQAVPILSKYLEASEQRIIQQSIIDILGQLGDTDGLSLSALLSLKERCGNAHTVTAINDLLKKMNQV